MKMEKVLDVLNEASFGAYVIIKLILKNRPSFVKVLNFDCKILLLLILLDGFDGNVSFQGSEKFLGLAQSNL